VDAGEEGGEIHCLFTKGEVLNVGGVDAGEGGELVDLFCTVQRRRDAKSDPKYFVAVDADRVR
jgi:hypothetical protein